MLNQRKYKQGTYDSDRESYSGVGTRLENKRRRAFFGVKLQFNWDHEVNIPHLWTLGTLVPLDLLPSSNTSSKLLSGNAQKQKSISKDIIQIKIDHPLSYPIFDKLFFDNF